MAVETTEAATTAAAEEMLEVEVMAEAVGVGVGVGVGAGTKRGGSAESL